MNEKEILDLGKEIRKQLIRKNAKAQITRFGVLVTSKTDDKLSLDHLMKLVSGYELKVDLSPLADVTNDGDLHKWLLILLGGMLSE